MHVNHKKAHRKRTGDEPETEHTTALSCPRPGTDGLACSGAGLGKITSCHASSRRTSQHKTRDSLIRESSHKRPRSRLTLALPRQMPRHNSESTVCFKPQGSPPKYVSELEHLLSQGAVARTAEAQLTNKEMKPKQALAGLLETSAFCSYDCMVQESEVHKCSEASNGTNIYRPS